VNNTLSKDTITKLLKSVEPKKDEPVNTQYKERWPGEVNLVKIAKAVSRNADFVLFRNGTRFSVTYMSDDTILVKPTSGFVPMGFFSRNQLKDAIATGIDLDEK
jgi:hypothetical protein